MLIDIVKIVGEETIKKIVEKAFDSFKSNTFTSSTNEYNRVKREFPELYKSHLNEICKWSYSIPFIGLNKAKQTDVSTIELLIASDILRKDIQDTANIKVTEEEILNTNDNILLIGPPGAGKTTTLKRLIIKYLQEISKQEKFGFPILVRLRKIAPDTTLSKYILDLFSIKYEDRIVKVVKRTKNKKKPNIIIEKIEEKLVTFVGETPIDLFLSQFLNENQSILLLDGLDEIEKSIQDQTFREIEELGLKLNKSKILLTVRKSELKKIIDNFSTYEIAPLSQTQIEGISKKWIKNYSGFLNELEKKPYKDLANRPIFLTLLMVLYEKYGILPTQPSEVYEDATYLIVKEWDEHRDIVRTSRYADFNTRKKIKFISEISYLLTYKIRQKIFSSKELEIIYSNIHEKYGLPEDEMKMIVSEIESHTGIIVESSYKNFEFSHLSIQEFLCAKHLVNLPYSQETISYFLEYPEPLAIAVSISGEPSLWFSNLILNLNLDINRLNKSNSIYTLLNRIIVESPSFKVLPELGYTFFFLVSFLYKENSFKPVFDDLFNYPGIKESLSIALKGCQVQEHKHVYYINKKEPTKTAYFIKIPYQGELPSKYIDVLLIENLISIQNNTIC